MRTLVIAVLLSTIAAVGTENLLAQARPILSPRDSVTLMLDTNKVSVNYGRPSMRGRVIMGQLVPWDKVWRTGANQATHLTTSFDMVMGGVPIPRGTYTLWTLPSPGGWKIIINKQTGQWGTQYDPGQDLARFDAKVESSPSVIDTFTISLEPRGKTSAALHLKWERTIVSTTLEKNDKIRPLSPLDSASIELAGKKIAVKYSKPYMRGRAIWGVVVPWDSVWRTGANLATSFTTDADLVIGTVSIPAGSYTLYSIPSTSSLILIINKKPGGTTPQYDPGMDLTRVVMSPESAATPVDPFRIWFEPSTANSATLRVGWADRVYSSTIAVKR